MKHTVSFSALLALTSLLPLLSTAMPLELATRASEPSCVWNDDTIYLYNEKGTPSPADLVRADHDGKPMDLSSLAAMRAIVELDSEKIKTLIQAEGGDNENWSDNCAKYLDAGNDFQWIPSKAWSPAVFGSDPEVPTSGLMFSFDEILGHTYDNDQRSAWPALLQYGLLSRKQGTDVNPDAFHQSDPADWPNIEVGATGIYNHMKEPNDKLHFVIDLLWKASGGEGTAKTSKIKMNGDQPDFNWVDEIVDKTREQNTPCLVATGKDNLGPFGGHPETVFTIQSSEKGWIDARDSQDSSDVKPLRLGTSDIARYAAMITWFEQ